jgi:hypothetical protein
MRIAFTIIHNGLHHLIHNEQNAKILDACDYWVVVEGASQSNGSTRWCKEFPEYLHKNGGSIDGTQEFLSDLASKEPRLVYVQSNGFWESKDQQVNRAIEEVRKLTSSCWLWQIDADEQWDEQAMCDAEDELAAIMAVAGTFRADCRIGKRLRAIGEWGEARTFGYIRLWKWNGEGFICHEPPILDGQMGIDPVMLTPAFTHYNYYFEQDVQFKDAWYGGHEGILDRWRLINSLDRRFFPVHISNLITGEWGKTNSSIVYCGE